VDDELIIRCERSSSGPS